MEYQKKEDLKKEDLKKEDQYDDYQTYSSSIIKRQEIKPGSAVFGYVPTEQEERENYKPVETMHMKNTEGSFSVGVNRQKEATIAITSNVLGPSLREDRSHLRMEGATRIKEIPDKMYTNSHDQKVSAIVYKEDLLKSPSLMIKNLKTAMEWQENTVADAVTPFLISRQDKEQKKRLEDYLRGSLESRNHGEYDAYKHEYNLLQKKLALKEREEQRLIQNLTSVVEKMKEQAQQLDHGYRKVSFFNIGFNDERDEEGEEEDNAKSGTTVDEDIDDDIDEDTK